jgi:diguanylate cyclase (GGDEF)-like protein
MPSNRNGVPDRAPARPARMLWAVAVLCFLVVLGMLAAGIALTHEQSKHQILGNLKARGATTASFASTLLSEQAVREGATAARFLSGDRGLGVESQLLANLVAHTISYPQHLVALIDTSGHVGAASPATGVATLRAADPNLAAAVARSSHGAAKIAGRASTFVVTPVPGTQWRLVIAVPNSRLFMTTSGWAVWLPWIVFALIAALGSAALLMFSRLLSAHARLQTLSAQLAQAARTDAGTGLANRRSLEERLAQASATANRDQQPLSVLAVDLDEFKRINDTHGHGVGDEVLREIAGCMNRVFRGSDVFGRWGGDEFLAILPGAREHAVLVGERLCAEVRAVDVSRYGIGEQLSISVGCAAAQPVSPQDLLIAADDSLYAAKRQGRGRVAVALQAHKGREATPRGERRCLAPNVPGTASEG